MTHLIERLVEIDRYVRHLREIRSRVPDRAALERDLSLHNDVLFSLLMICQSVIDVASEMGARGGERFEDYTSAIRALSRRPEFPAAVVQALEPLAGFRNVLVHEYVTVNLDRVIEALERLDDVERFVRIIRDLEDPNTRR